MGTRNQSNFLDITVHKVLSMGAVFKAIIYYPE